MQLPFFRTKMIALSGVGSTLVLVGVVRLLLLWRSVKANQRYWERRAGEDIEPGDFIYLALGDSVASGIGSSRPTKGYVGLIAQHIKAKTGRHVHVINTSVTGAKTIDVIREQLPRIGNLQPDLVTLDIGANDVNKKVPEEVIIQNFKEILDRLPAKKTIVSDLPTFQRGPQRSTLLRLNTAIHDEITNHDFELAPIFEVTSATIHDVRTYAADLFHPSNRGHRNWYRAFAPGLDDVLDRDDRQHWRRSGAVIDVASDPVEGTALSLEE